MVRVWSYPSRIISPWLMSAVHGGSRNVTLLALANGLASVSASGVHSPPMLGDVQDRKYRRPSEPIASTSNRYWWVPATRYTLLASNSANLLGSCIAMTGWLMPLGKSATVVWDRYRWPLSS